MKPTKAPGLDGICAGMLRKAWPVLADTITRLFKRCIQGAIFPKSCKIAKLVVIPKPGNKDKTNPKSYRPISLLPTLAKPLETIIIQDLNVETGVDNIGEQHGFVPGRSTLTAIKSVYDWTDDNRYRYVFGIFLDITGAFENVSWYPVLKRLKDIGASARTLSLIKNYLQGRTVKLPWKERLLAKNCKGITAGAYSMESGHDWSQQNTRN